MTMQLQTEGRRSGRGPAGEPERFILVKIFENPKGVLNTDLLRFLTEDKSGPHISDTKTIGNHRRKLENLGLIERNREILSGSLQQIVKWKPTKDFEKFKKLWFDEYNIPIFKNQDTQLRRQLIRSLGVQGFIRNNLVPILVPPALLNDTQPLLAEFCIWACQHSPSLITHILLLEKQKTPNREENCIDDINIMRDRLDCLLTIISYLLRDIVNNPDYDNDILSYDNEIKNEDGDREKLLKFLSMSFQIFYDSGYGSKEFVLKIIEKGLIREYVEHHPLPEFYDEKKLKTAKKKNTESQELSAIERREMLIEGIIQKREEQIARRIPQLFDL